MIEVSQCQICMKEFGGKFQLPAILQCGHTMCFRCISEGMNRYRKISTNPNKMSRFDVVCKVCFKLSLYSGPNLLINQRIKTITAVYKVQRAIDNAQIEKVEKSHAINLHRSQHKEVVPTPPCSYEELFRPTVERIEKRLK